MIDDGHPSRVVKEFVALVFADPIPTVELDRFVTPQSRTDWGDYAEARAFFERGYGLSNRALRPAGSPDVAYVKLIAQDTALHSPVPLDADAYVTLVWLSSAGAWAIHSFGTLVHPDLLVREPNGRPPTYATDSNVSIS